MRHWPRRYSVWDNDSTSKSSSRSGPDPINPLRVQRLRSRGLTYREIGTRIAREDGRQMAYCGCSVRRALMEYLSGRRDEDGERDDFIPATNRRDRGATAPR